MRATIGIALALLLVLCSCAPGPALTALPTQFVPSPLPTPSPRPVRAPTATLLVPLPTATSALRPTLPPLAFPGICPAPGTPPFPEQPQGVDKYGPVLLDYLNAGAGPEELEQLLELWATRTFLGEAYQDGDRDPGPFVYPADLTGDGVPEILVVAAYRYSHNSPAWGRLFIFRCADGQVELEYTNTTGSWNAAGDDSDAWSCDLLDLRDLNGDSRPEAAFSCRWCGAHTCEARLFVAGGRDGQVVDLAPGFSQLPEASYSIQEGRITADAGWYGSVGAGLARDYRQVWDWNGSVFTLTQEIYGPPTTRLYYLYDGDDALLRGDGAAAIANYQQAIAPADMESGVFPGSRSEGWQIILALTRFKLVVAYAVTGDSTQVEEMVQLLRTETPSGLYTQMAEAFWAAFQEGAAAADACAAAVALVGPDVMSEFYAGYAHFGGFVATRYKEPADLCRVP